jgi:hypothetical protein
MSVLKRSCSWDTTSEATYSEAENEILPFRALLNTHVRLEEVLDTDGAEVEPEQPMKPFTDISFSYSCPEKARIPRLSRAEEVEGKDEQLDTILLLLLLSQTVLGLGDLELAVSLESDKANTKIGSSEVESDEVANLLAGRVLRRVGEDEDGLALRHVV